MRKILLIIIICRCPPHCNRAHRNESKAKLSFLLKGRGGGGGDVNSGGKKKRNILIWDGHNMQRCGLKGEGGGHNMLVWGHNMLVWEHNMLVWEHNMLV